VGSHILDRLRRRGIATRILLRPASDRYFIADHLSQVEVHSGSITEPRSLPAALEGITHVIHCAGSTKALHNSDFYHVNQIGTRNLVEAVNGRPQEIRRFLHVSSLAASGPATAEQPAREENPPAPVSEYGRSKLAGEMEVRQGCRTEFVVVRPPAVYGPRDAGFLSMFKAVRRHLLPRPSARQTLSIVFVEDLADAILACLECPAAAGQTYFAASRETTTGRRMAEEIARQMNQWTIPFPLPTLMLWPVCLFEHLKARVTRKASLLNLQKFAELRAPGWVCDPGKLQREVGYECKTRLPEGIAAALAWYQSRQWRMTGPSAPR